MFGAFYSREEALGYKCAMSVGLLQKGYEAAGSGRPSGFAEMRLREFAS